MSLKLPVSKVISNELCASLSSKEIHQSAVQKSNFLDRHSHNKCTNKLKALLQNVVELQTKYVELDDFKKVSCIHLDRLVPVLKTEEDDEDSEEGNRVSETRLEQIKVNRRRRRKFCFSFYNQHNLIAIDSFNFHFYKFEGTTLMHFEQRKQDYYNSAVASLQTPDPFPNQFTSPEKTRQLQVNNLG